MCNALLTEREAVSLITSSPPDVNLIFSAAASLAPVLNNSDVVSVTYTTPDGCSVSKALIMVENAITSAGTISPTVKLTICSGDTPSKLTSISSPTASGDMSYKWYTSTDTLNWDEISSTNSASY